MGKVKDVCSKLREGKVKEEKEGEIRKEGEE
jgi:hypothetical protein